MEEKKNGIDKILSLSQEDLKKIFAKMTPAEIIDLINRLNEVNE